MPTSVTPIDRSQLTEPVEAARVGWQEKETYAVLEAQNDAEHPADAFMAVYDALGRAYDRGKQGDEEP